MDIDEASPGKAAVRLTLTIEGGPDGDADEVERSTGRLRRDLLELDVEDVEPVHVGEVPAGAKSVDPASVGALVVTLAPAAIQGLVAVVRAWLQARPVSSVKVTLGRDSLELTNASSEQMEELTRAFIARHGAR
jgi:hypothetical protein